jgi:hypothetical protein
MREVFNENLKERAVKNKKVTPISEKEELTTVFECNVPECTYTCTSFREMASQLQEIESVYDRIRKDWAAKFQSADVPQSSFSASTATLQPVENNFQ